MMTEQKQGSLRVDKPLKEFLTMDDSNAEPGSWQKCELPTVGYQPGNRFDSFDLRFGDIGGPAQMESTDDPCEEDFEDLLRDFQSAVVRGEQLTLDSFEYEAIE